MNAEYIIVQAGGKGTRLLPYTKNMPKVLVPVQNKPLIFHLFERYPQKKFIIIGDYKNEVLERYLENFAKVSYITIKADKSGNVAGIKQALSYIPQNTPFMLIWSDLLLGDNFAPENLPNENYIGVTDEFPCSWRYLNGSLEKISSETDGVAGCFIFSDKSILNNIPIEGSFTQWLKQSNIALAKMSMSDTKEVGSIDALKKISTMENRSRPYNKITIEGDVVRKDALTKDAQKLLDAEIAWYKEASKSNFSGIPRIMSLSPLTMEKINGETIFSSSVPKEKQPIILENIVKRLRELHKIGECEKNRFDIEKDYYQKTLQRLRTINSVIPFADKEIININRKARKNPLFCLSLYKEMVEAAYNDCKNFGLIHGDCTFSNLLTDDSCNIYMIDARGYFGHTPLIGDLDYDWAKVYYSVVGAFDQFNVRKFNLDISEDDVPFSITPSGWEEHEKLLFNLIPEASPARIRFIHAVIWLSLASHCNEDYDSMCLAFYNGVELFNKSIEEYTKLGGFL